MCRVFNVARSVFTVNLTLWCIFSTLQCTVTVVCSVFTVYFTMKRFLVLFSAITVHCSLKLYSVRCTLLRSYSQLYYVVYLVYTLICSVFNVNYTMLCVHCTVYSKCIDFTLHSEVYFLYTVKKSCIYCTLYSYMSLLLNVHFTSYKVHS